MKSTIYKKIKQIIAYINKELDKPRTYHSEETILWEKGYRKAMKEVKEFIINIFNEKDL